MQVEKFKRFKIKLLGWLLLKKNTKETYFWCE